jgi:hypothetical protein
MQLQTFEGTADSLVFNLERMDDREGNSLTCGGAPIETADRILYQRVRASAATRLKAKEIIETNQFTPNPIARRLKRNRLYRFCALIPHSTAGSRREALGTGDYRA